MQIADRVQGEKLVGPLRAQEVHAAQADRVARASAVQILHDVIREVDPVLSGLAEFLVGTPRGLLLDDVVGECLDHLIVAIEETNFSSVIDVVYFDEHEAAAHAAVAKRETKLVAIDFLEAREPFCADPGCGLRRLQHHFELVPPLGVSTVQHDIIVSSIYFGLEQSERIAARAAANLRSK